MIIRRPTDDTTPAAPSDPANAQSIQQNPADPQDPASLPPLGQINADNQSLVNTFIDRLALKAINYFTPFCDKADDNLHIFEHGKRGAVRGDEVVSNKIRNDVLTLVNAILREPVTLIVEPQATGEPPQMIPIAGADGMPAAGPDGQQQQFRIDDVVQARWEQKGIQYFFDAGDLFSDIESAMLNNRIGGWVITPYQWDRRAGVPELLTEVSIRQVLLDPAVGPIKAVEKANWAILLWRVNYWQARAMYPAYAKLMGQRARLDTAQRDPILRLGENQEYKSVGETMVDLVFFWVRNYPAQKMTPDEAVQHGEVEQRTVPVQPGMGIDGSDLGAGAGAGAPGGDIQSGTGGESADDTGARFSAGDGATEPAAPEPGLDDLAGGFPDNAAAEAQPGAGVGGMRAGYFLPGSDIEVTPDSAEWPWWLCTRQITRIDREVVDDRTCPHWDIPLLHMVATPIPLSPCGQGDPETLIPMQEGRNRALTSAVEHADLMAHPVKVFSRGAWEALDSRYKEDGASIAGMTVIVGDDLYKALGGKINVVEDAPPISSSINQILEILGKEINDDAQAPQVLQGKQGDISGWQSVQLLQQQATSRFDLPAKFLEKYVRRLMQFVRWSMLWEVPMHVLQGIFPEYPPEALAALVERGRRNDANTQAQVNISTGGVAARKVAEAVQKFQLGIISKQTLTERMGEDFEQEEQRKAQEAQGQQQQQPPSMAINFKDAPPEAQAQMLAMDGIQVSPEQMQQHQANQQAQKQQEIAARKQAGQPGFGGPNSGS